MIVFPSEIKETYNNFLPGSDISPELYKEWRTPEAKHDHSYNSSRSLDKNYHRSGPDVVRIVPQVGHFVGDLYCIFQAKHLCHSSLLTKQL